MLGDDVAAPHRDDVTQLLARIQNGDDAATPELLNVAYDQLRAVAANLFDRGLPDQTLQPTALVNELCVRLLDTSAASWNDRHHFFAAAARAMRNLLADHARARRAQKRGGDAIRVSLNGHEAGGSNDAADLVDLDDTLTKLGAMDQRLERVFELRFLAGVSVVATAEMLGVSPRTVEVDTRFIRAWLQKELAP